MATKFRSKRVPAEPIGYRDSVHDDPLSQAMMPPEDESPEARALRLEEMQEATRVSREIDESLQESKRVYERRKKAIKVLLLGGSFEPDMRSYSALGTQ
jgi:guanine nucleotide-binding protein subunit alpha